MPQIIGPVVAPIAYTPALTLGPSADDISYINLVCTKAVYVTLFVPIEGMPPGKYTDEGEERYIAQTHLTGVSIANVSGIKIRSADPANLATVQAELAYVTDPQFSALPSSV